MEHLRRSFNYTINHLGPHGLPQIGRADWNDCLNLNCFSEEPGESFQTFGPSEGPNAESVFIAGMFVKYGKDYVKICRHKGLCDEADTAQKAIEQMEKTVMDAGWDGEWYLRAYDHYKHKIGSKECEDGKIFIEPQGFCVIAEIGKDEGLCLKAMQSVENILILNMASCSCSRLTTDIMWSLVKSLLIHRDTRRMPASSATTILGFL